MTLEEARTRLGLPPAGQLEKAEVRRAYLQAIKRCKPEVDPEGFKAVREAYELLKGLLEMGMPLPAPPVVTGAPAATGAPEDSAPPAEEDEPVPQVDHLRPYREKLNGDPAAREFLLDLLPLDAARNDIIALLLEGVRTGDTSCLLRLIQLAPEAVPAELLVKLEAEGGVFERFLVAQALVRRNENERGLSLLERVLDEAASRQPEPMLVEWTLQLSLELDGRPAPALAKEVRARLQKYLGTPSLPADVATPRASALFATIGDLERADYLPPEVRAELARGTIEQRWDRLPAVLADAERALGPGSFERKLDRLRGESPTLSAVVHAHRPQQAVGSGESWWQSGWLRTLVVIFALSVVRMASRGGCDSSSREPLITIEPLKDDNPALKDALRLHVEVNNLCRLQMSGDKLCGLLSDFMPRLGREDCPTLQQELRLLREKAGDLSLSQERQLDRIAAALPGMCRP
jgi:hypothetical protein